MSSRPRESYMGQHYHCQTSNEIIQRNARTNGPQIPASLQDIARRPTETNQLRNQSLKSSRVGQERSQSRGTLGYKRSTLFIQTEPIQTPRLPNQCNDYPEYSFYPMSKKDEVKQKQIHQRNSLVNTAIHNRSSSTHVTDELGMSFNPNKMLLLNMDLDEKQRKSVLKEIQCKDSKIAKLKTENEKLTNELHKMKKADAGMMFGGNNKVASENLEMKGLIDSLKDEIFRLKQAIGDKEVANESSREMNSEITRLRKAVAQYESEKQRMTIDLGQAVKSQEDKDGRLSSAVKEIANLKRQVSIEQERYDKVVIEKEELKLKCQTLFSQVSANKGNETKNASYEKSFVKLHGVISSLEKENKRLTDQVKECRFQLDKDMNLREQIHEAKKQLAKVSEEKDALKNRLKGETDRVQTLSKEKDALNFKLIDLEAKLSMAIRKANTTADDDSSRRIESENLIFMHKQKADEKTREVSNLQMQVDSLKNEIQSLTQDNTTKQFQLELTRMELQKKDGELVIKARAEFDSLREEISHLNQENVKLRDRIKELQKTENSFKLNRLKLSEYDHLDDSFLPLQHVEGLILRVILGEMEIKRLQSKLTMFRDTNESVTTEPDSILNQVNNRYQRVVSSTKQRSCSTISSRRDGYAVNADFTEKDSIDMRVNIGKIRADK
jgi:chromosome segregation ATPase